MFTLKSQDRSQLNQNNHIYYRQMDVIRLVFSQQNRTRDIVYAYHSKKC